MRSLTWYERVVIYALTGWCVELFFTGIFSVFSGDPKLTAWTYLWMLPIWGFGVFGMEKISNVMDAKEVNIRIRIVVFMLACFSLEYVSGIGIQLLTGIIPWDYSGSVWSVGGAIRLDYAPFWAVSGIFLEPFIDFINDIDVPTKKNG